MIHWTQPSPALVTEGDAQRDTNAPVQEHGWSCAISQLPPEILAQIFITAKARSLCTTLTHRSPWKGRSWMNVAAVCRTWRDIALDTPRLWNSFDISRSSSVHTFLARSKSAPLRIHCKSGPFEARHHNSIVEEIMLRFALVEELNLSSPDLTEFFAPLHRQPLAPLPLLQVLRLTATSVSSTPFVLPRSLVSRELPSLRALELINVTISSTLNSFPQLTRLRLSSQSTNYSITLQSLIHMLLHTPNLEDLSLACVIVNSLDEPMPSTFTLDRLKNVSIKSPGLHCSLLFKYLDHPTSTIIQLESNQVSSLPSPDISGLLALCSSFKRQDSPLLNVIKISSSASPPRYLSLSMYSSSSSPLCTIHITAEEPITRLTEICLEVCRVLSSSTVTTLRLDGLEGFQHSSWLELFQNFTMVQRIEASYVSNRFLAPLLGELNEHPPLPQLRQLEFRYCDFGTAAPRCPHPHSHPHHGAGELVITMRQVIQKRHAWGVSMPAFKLRQCQISAREVGELEECAEVDWDYWDGQELID